MTAMSNDEWGKDQRAAGWDNKQGEEQVQPNSGGWEPVGDRSATQNWDQPSPQTQGQQHGGSWAVSQGQPPHQDAQQQPAVQEWHTGAQQQHSAGEQHSANEWTTGAEQHASASEWRGDGQQWNVQGQPGPGGQTAPNWNQNPQGNFPPGQQWQQQPPKEPTGLANLFDLSFKRFVLPSGGGTMFMIVAIGFLVRWLFDLIWTLSYGPDVIDLMQVLLGELAVTFVYILLARAFLEGMSALVSMSMKKDTGRS